MSIDEATKTVPAFSLVGSTDLQREIEQFYYFESRILDERRFHDWLDLFTDDTHYWMPVRYNRLLREIDKETAKRGEISNFDETKKSLGQRVTRLDTGMAWAEDPPSRTRHLVTNVFIQSENGGEYEVENYFLIYRNRGDSEVDIWAGKRNDLLRRVGPCSFQIARRHILLDQSTILAKNLSVFF